MDLVFNELSYYPLASDDYEAERRLEQFINTYKEAKLFFIKAKIRFPSDNWKRFITREKTTLALAQSTKNSNIKRLICKWNNSPPADDLLGKEELDAFCEGSYEIADKAVPTQQSPVGLAIAYLKSIPTLSLDAHPFWRKREIPLRRTRTAEPEKETPSKTEKKEALIVYNLCLERDLEESEIRAWWDATKLSQIHSAETLKAYLSYSKYQVDFDKGFLDEIFKWKEKDRKLFDHILLLMKDVEPNPFTGGIGKTEPLKSIKGGAAKRITDKDRLVYCLKEGTVRFIACKGHYEDH